MIYDPEKLDTLSGLAVNDNDRERSCKQQIFDSILLACLRLNYVNVSTGKNDTNSRNNHNKPKMSFNKHKTVSWDIGEWENCSIQRRFRLIQLNEPHLNNFAVGQKILHQMKTNKILCPVTPFFLFFFFFVFPFVFFLTLYPPALLSFCSLILFRF